MHIKKPISPKSRCLVTGGLGFIGSHFIEEMLRQYQDTFTINLDHMTYAANPDWRPDSPHYQLVKGDIRDQSLLDTLFSKCHIDTVVHFAAETHVDRSIANPVPFFEANIQGTAALLEAAKQHWRAQPDYPDAYQFVYISTDEVYGSSPDFGKGFSEDGPINPSNPYSASKAAAEQLVSCYHMTYGLPCIITRCANNFGPRQYPEKLIPSAIQRFLQQKQVPVYGDGQQRRCWIYVKDHARALLRIMDTASPGETVNVPGRWELENIRLLERLYHAVAGYAAPGENAPPFREVIQHVPDRPAHDRRYLMDSQKFAALLPDFEYTNFDHAITETVNWYRDRQHSL